MSRAARIIAAQRRADEALALVSRYRVTDPRFDLAYADWQEALAERSKAENGR